jgi:hypothetical protein
MPTLTCRYPERPDCWHIYYGDVRVGTIARRILTTPIRGNGLAGSTPAVIRESIKRAPPKRSTRPVLSSQRHGQCFHRSELRPTFRNGAMHGTGQPGNMPCGKLTRDCRRRSPTHSCDAPAAKPSTVAASNTRCSMFRISRSPRRLTESAAGRSAKDGLETDFRGTIPLRRGRQLVTLEDAGNYIAKLPKPEYLTAEWQAAVFALMLVVDLNGPTMMARIGIMRALNRNVVREFDSSRKDTHWGKRKLKRDQ